MSSVLIVVFDGLQPAQVNPRLMPHLAEFAAQGVTFTNHHPVYPTVTRANAASLVTGRTPGGHGLAANNLLIRDFDPCQVVGALEPVLAQVARKTGQVLLAPTLADILSQHGAEYIAIGVGTSGNAYVHNPRAEQSGGATIHPDFTLPGSLHQEIIGRFGPWPAESRPNTPRFVHAVRILTEYILSERKPLVSLIWSSEPDKSQHDFGVGSPESDQAIQEADQQFGELLHWLEDADQASETDVMVVSDHGYSTISGAIDVQSLLREDGFPDIAQPGGVAVANNGGSVLFYTHQQDPATADRLAQWLMAQAWCGPITSSEAVGHISGALPLALVSDEGTRAPELTMSFRWDARPDDSGYVGHVYSTSGASGQGQHGSMSQQELHNILFARGPSFRQQARVDTPSGNTDLTPTILRILSIADPTPMDGRVLDEAVAGGPDASQIDWHTELHNAERKLVSQVYRQQIKLSRVGSTTYVDQGSSTLGSR